MRRPSDDGKQSEGGTVRRFIVLVALCAVATLLFAPAALADHHIMSGDDMMSSASASAMSTASASAMSSASASASATPLPSTGGVVSPGLLAVVPALLLAGSGLMAVRVIRRS